ncbi:CDKN2A-interacting protein [Eucyclogobius newberryi]|uniref:CDKN2A-interacting protein n=1 Tax=Eucyclogobius newberryi TaxID=166745 RepID=UPI003B5AE0D4
MSQQTVNEFLAQNPQVSEWAESLRGTCETLKQWNARKTFILQNMEVLGLVPEPGLIPEPGLKLDQLLALSMVWANHVFMGCRYPESVMDRVLPMAEDIEVLDAPQFTTRDQIMSRTKRSLVPTGSDSGSCVKRSKAEPSISSPATTATFNAHQKCGPSAQAPAQLQPFFNRLYKAVCWKLVSAGGLGPNLDHFEVLRGCVESCKQTLSCVLVPLKEITGLPAGRAQKEGHVCELRCQGVYLGTGYGRDEAAARAMASKEALKVFQGRKVLVKICRRKFQGREVDDLMLLDEQPRSQGFPPALSHPFSPGYREEVGS